MFDFQIKRGTEALKPELKDGEFYLAKDKESGNLIIKNGDKEIVIANQDLVDALTTQLGELVNTVSTLNTTMETKLTTPSGTAGQVLGYTANNTVGAVTLNKFNVVTNASQPSG